MRAPPAQNSVRVRKQKKKTGNHFKSFCKRSKSHWCKTPHLKFLFLADFRSPSLPNKVKLAWWAKSLEVGRWSPTRPPGVIYGRLASRSDGPFWIFLNGFFMPCGYFGYYGDFHMFSPRRKSTEIPTGRTYHAFSFNLKLARKFS